MKRARLRTKSVGLVGIGLLGTALAGRFLKANLCVVGFDIDGARMAAFRKAGGVAAASAAEVFDRCESVVLSLPTSDIAAKLVDEHKDSLKQGSLVIDTTTGDPDQTEKLARRLAKRGVEHVDATILGSSVDTREGRAVILAGGSASALRRARPFLKALTARIISTGASGSGARMKLVANLVLGLNRAVLAEGLAFAKAAGISPELALEVLQSGAAYSRVMDTKGRKMMQGDYTPQARLAQHYKDVRLILKLGVKTKSKLPLSRVHARLLNGLVAAGHGGSDNSAIIEAFR